MPSPEIRAAAARAAADTTHAVFSADTGLTFDAVDSDVSLEPDRLYLAPIFYDLPGPGRIISGPALRPNLLDSGPEWSFWREWYQGFLIGAILDRALQKEIALIPDADWEKGPEWIAAKIEIIRKRRELESEIAKLKEQLKLAQSAATLPNRLHNQPPEAVDDAALVFRREITVLWSEIDALENEIAKPDPLPTVVKKIASRLSAVAVSVVKYCGSVADVSVKAGAKIIGTAAGTAIIAEMALPGSMQAVVRLILEFVKAWGGFGRVTVR